MRLLRVDPRELEHPLLAGVIARMEAGEWAELRRSVAEQGVLVPVLAHREGDRLVIDDGLRRVAAAVLAEHGEIPVVLLEDGDEVSGGPEALTLIANAVRDRNPIAEYRAIRSLVDRGWTHEQIADVLGLNRSTVSYRLRLDRVMPELLEEAERGRVPYAVLRRLPSYPPEVQAEVLRRVRAGERVRVRDLADMTRAPEVTPVDLSGLAEAVEALDDDVAALRRAMRHLERAAEDARAAGIPALALLITAVSGLTHTLMDERGRNRDAASLAIREVREAARKLYESLPRG